VAGTTVTFAASAGNGTVTPGTTATASDGTASTSWTLGSTAGTENLTAAALGLTGSPVAFTATALQAGLSSIVQDTLVEGSTATLNGFGFSTVAANNTVDIDGVPATVTAATATQLTVTVPTYDCLPARDANTTVTVGGATTNAIVKRINPKSFLSLATGTQTILDAAANGCLEFPASSTGGDGYLLGVGAAAESP